MAAIALTPTLAALSIATDLGSGFPAEKGVRSCLVAIAVGRAAGAEETVLADAFQATLLHALGCTGFAVENAAWFDDDMAFQRTIHTLDITDPQSLAAFGEWAGRERAAELRATFIRIAPTVGPQAAAASCEAARVLGARLGLRPGALAAIDHVHERWDGRGIPGTCAGAELPLAARLLHLAAQAVAAHLAGGPPAALATLGRRAGGQLDPELVALVEADPAPLMAALAEPDPVAAALAAEPSPRARLAPAALDRVAEAFADLADLKSRFTLGHSRGVAELAARAGALAGLSAAATDELRWAGMLHDVGRLSVSSATWERPGPLSAVERDVVRLHSYWSERVISRAPPFAGLAPVAGAHHERLDGTGYHRSTLGASLSLPARLLAAADVLHALTEDRPHRPACPLAEASATIAVEAEAGRLDPDAVAAVIEAAGAPRPRRSWPAGLTDREVEVVRLAAQGLTNLQIADRLVVSPRTVGHHLAHIYDKTGRRTRAGTALFAVEHGLLAAGAGDSGSR